MTTTAEPDIEEHIALPEAEFADGVMPPSSVQWTASEFIAHDKSSAWYLGLVIVGVLLTGLVYLATHDFISVFVIVLGTLLFGIYGARKPRQLDYRVDLQGISVGRKHYPYDDFRSFSVMPEGAFSSIVFMPLKRFSPPLTVYYAPQDEQKIMAILSRELPFEEQRRDAVENLMRKIRF